MRILLCLTVLCIGISSLGTAQKREDKQLSNRVTALSPEEQLQRFRLAPGFRIELVASEKDGIVKPIDLAFDDAGNLWTQTAVMYPLDPVSDIQWNDLLELMNDGERQQQHPAFKRVSDLYRGITKGDDKILKLSGIYDNKLSVSTWADGLAIPMSILPVRDALYVAQGSEIFLLKDENRDGKADTRTPLFTGFGFTDSHTMTHLLRKGPGGWIHFSHGALNKGLVTSYLQQDVKTRFDYSKIGRFSVDGRKMEVLTAGLNNIWGYTLRANGQWYGSEANDLGHSIVPLDEGTAFPGIGNEKFRAYQPFYPPIHSFRVGGTGLSGLAFSEDDRDGFPEYWKNVGFLANPITNSINAVRMIQQPDGSIVSEHLEDLLVSGDDWFRPVNISFGPDGCLYIADWYNKIVSHNEVPTSHPDRDKSHGRIWRIRHESQPVRQIVDFNKVPAQDLPGYLKSPYLWERRAAWNQISEREKGETRSLVPDLVAIVDETDLGISARIHAMWALESLGYFNEDQFRNWLTDNGDDIRREAVRYLSTYPEEIEKFMPVYRQLKTDPNATVRAQLIRTLGYVRNPSQETLALLVDACNPDMDGNVVGGSYERKFERYLARKALEENPQKLVALLESSSADRLPPANLLWGIQVLPVAERARYYFKYAAPYVSGELSEAAFLDIAQMASDSKARDVLLRALREPEYRSIYIQYALKHRSELNTDDFKKLLELPVASALKEGDIGQKRQALEAIASYGLNISGSEIAKAAGTSPDDAFLNMSVRALDAVKDENSRHYLNIAEKKSLSQGIRSNALQGVIRTDRKLGKATTLRWLATMDAVEKKALTNVLSRYAASAGLLMELYQENKLVESDFELMTAERIYTLVSRKEGASKLVEAIRKNEEMHKLKVGAKIKSLVPLATGGDIRKGEMLFQTCLTCHQVGGKGQQIAPSLDGLAHRDTEGLLFAVLDPDAAIEAGYALFRIVKKDNSMIDGYLVNRDSAGSTLAFMGGSQLFIPVADIKSQYHVAGKSFMPSGLFDHYSKKDIRDILSFIKTIK